MPQQANIYSVRYLPNKGHTASITKHTHLVGVLLAFLQRDALEDHLVPADRSVDHVLVALVTVVVGNLQESA